MRLCFALLLVNLSCGAFAQDKPCAKADAARAEKAVERVVSWAQLQKAYQDFRHCDTGPVAELFTEASVRLLVQWKEVDAIAASMQDASFRAFVERHLNDPTAKDDLDSIYSRAKQSCPSKHEAFCAQLAELVKAAGK